MDCSPPGSSVHGILQTRVLEWGAIAFSNINLMATKLISWFNLNNRGIYVYIIKYMFICAVTENKIWVSVRAELKPYSTVFLACGLLNFIIPIFYKNHCDRTNLTPILLSSLFRAFSINCLYSNLYPRVCFLGDPT